MSDKVEVTKVNVTPSKQEEIDDLIREAIKAKFGKPVAVVAALDRRYTNKPGVWGAYQRYLLENGHTIFVSLTDPRNPKASVSDKEDKWAISKVEKREKREAKAKAAKEAREAKKAAQEKAKTEKAAVPKAEPKAKKTPKADKTA